MVPYQSIFCLFHPVSSQREDPGIAPPKDACFSTSYQVFIQILSECPVRCLESHSAFTPGAFVCSANLEVFASLTPR
jgi:hypothetical protein